MSLEDWLRATFLVFLFGLILNVPVNSYGHVGIVIYTFPGQYYWLSSLSVLLAHTFARTVLVTDNNPSWISRREENDRRNYFIINLHVNMGTIFVVPDLGPNCLQQLTADSKVLF